MLTIGQLVARAALVVGRVVAGRHLDRAGAELGLDRLVRDHRDLAVDEAAGRSVAPTERRLALVVGMHGHAGVAQHRLGPRRRDGDELAAARRLAPGSAMLPQLALARLVLDLVVADGRLRARSPSSRGARRGRSGPSRTGARTPRARRATAPRPCVKRRARPVARAAQAPELLEDVAAVLLLPRPDALEERLAAEVAGASSSPRRRASSRPPPAWRCRRGRCPAPTARRSRSMRW